MTHTSAEQLWSFSCERLYYRAMVFGLFFTTFIALTKVIGYFAGRDSDKSVSTPEAKQHQEQASICVKPTAPKKKCCKRRKENHSLSGVKTKRRKDGVRIPRIGNLQCTKVLGEGAYGKVYLCQDNETNCKYAVKKVTAESDFQTERQILSLVGSCINWNKFLVTAARDFVNEDPRCLVMEFIQGGDLLADLNRDQQYTERKARFYTAEIICGLEFLHLHGIVHRDLKFENVLLNNGHVKIADFGLAYRLKGICDKIEQNVIYGTPNYVAPEVILHSPYDSSCDWWALGVMLFAMLTGSMPFYGETQAELFLNILFEDPQVPNKETLSVESMELFLHLLEKDVQDRIGYKGGNYPWIKDHAFFREVNWSQVESLKMDPP